MREPVWCVFPARDITTYKFFLDKGVIGVGIADMGDIRKLYPDRESLKQEWMRRYPDINPDSTNQLYSILYRFAIIISLLHSYHIFQAAEVINIRESI